MRLEINSNNFVAVDSAGTITVTRQCVLGGIGTHVIRSPYSAEEIHRWIEKRMSGARMPLVQNTFMDMKEEDREFLMSGITPARYASMEDASDYG